MKNLKSKIISVLGVFTILLMPLHVFAASGTVGYGSETLSYGQTKEITVSLNSASDVQAVGGRIGIADSNCATLGTITPANGNVVVNDKMFAFASMSEIPSGTAIVKVRVTAGTNACTTRLTFADTDITSTSSVDSAATISAGDIKVGSSTPTPSKSSNNNLSNLTVSKGSLSPAFSASTTSYQVEVENDVDSINVSATLADTKASITGTGTKSLNVGSNTIDVIVTAEDGTPKTYKIIVVRKSSDGEGGETPDPTPEDTRSKDNTLKSLEISGHSFEPGFDANTTAYSLTVGNDVTSLDVNAIANDEKAAVAISGNTDLKVGVNNINVTVTAENGSQRIYTIKVIRNNESGGVPEEVTSKSSENRLRALVAAEGAFTTNFDPNTNTYFMTVASDVNELSLTARPMDYKSKVDIVNNGGFVAGETKVVSVIVTAEDGSQRIYTINVTKSDKEADTKLKELTVSGGSLDPRFDPDKYVYTVEVGSGTKSISVNGIPQNPNSKVEYSINGGTFTDNGNLPLEEGSNIVVVKVTDENGLTRQYVINVEKDSSYFKLFGIKMPKWLGYVLLFLLLLLLGWLLFLLLKRRKKKEEEKVQMTQAMPNIEIKPEFNFGSKNQDNDSIDDGGILNQNSSHASATSEDNDGNGTTSYDYDDDKTEVIPYDPYDEIVTKDEIIDAIEEKDPEKLKILYKQEMLNREKEKIKAKEEAKKD